MLSAPWFAAAGLALAAGPILIHLLNRQRFRVVEWAAMEFLRQAVRRSRRMIRLQDLVLLAVRVLCVLLFGLAMARPYFVSPGQAVDPGQPVHVVLLVDNSLSMGYEQLGRTVLDEARGRAKELIDRVPAGSRVSVIPICASAREFSFGAYSTKEDALEALAAIQPVDRAATAAAALDLAKEACRRTPSPPNKQIVLLSDQQSGNWPAESLDQPLAQLGAPLQIVELAPKEPENAWVADFRLQDGIADLESPAVFLATVRFEGAAPRGGVEVTLSIDGAVFATQTIDLEPGQAREVRFPAYRFDARVSPGQVAFVPAEVSIPHDHLVADDRRLLVVPVVSALPVVMVDQWGEEEAPGRNRFGETRRLRQLLAPATARRGASTMNSPLPRAGEGQGVRARDSQDRDPQLIRIRHVKFDQLDRELLKDARLVAIAGVERPEPAATISLLREYVEQGGSIVLAAGGDFDPADWTVAAWQDGQGILPAPLKPDAVGALPGASSKTIQPFQLDVASLAHDYFTIEQATKEELDDLWRRPFFFKAAEADLGQDRSRPLPLRDGPPAQWLLWSDALEEGTAELPSADEQAERGRPRVLASFTNRVPFLIERRIGRGRVVFVSTGVFREWNTLTSTDAVVLFDRMFRDLLQRTVPRRNLATSEQIVMPVPAELRDAKLTLADPAGREESASVDALGGHRFGVVVRDLAQRGIWRLVARGASPSGQPAGQGKLLEMPLGANGPAAESELLYLDEASLRARAPEAEYRWVGRAESIRITAGAGTAQDLWRWLMLAVLVGLAGESLILAWPLVRRERSP